MSSQLKVKEAGRLAATLRLQLRSPGTKRRVKRKMQDAARRNGVEWENQHGPTMDSEAAPQKQSQALRQQLQTTPQPTMDSPCQVGRSNDGTLSLQHQNLSSLQVEVGPITVGPSMDLSNMRGNSQLTLPEKSPTKSRLQRPRRGRGRKHHSLPTDSQLACNTEEGSLRGHGGARGAVGRGGGPGQKNVKRGGGRKLKKMPAILRTPPGWVAPTINLENRHSPPSLRHTTQKARVVRNLLDAVDAAADLHGAHRLFGLHEGGSDTSGNEQHQLPSATEVQVLPVSLRDCKEAPQISRCTSEKKGKALLTTNDSAGWYNSCDSEDCSHGRLSACRWDTLTPGEEGSQQLVTVLPHLLGLSPTSNGGQVLRGEVIREFIHAVTGDDMLLIDFAGVIGERALPTKVCLVEGVDGGGPSTQRRSSSPTAFGATQQRLLPQFQATDFSEDGLTQFLVGGDLELPPLIGEDTTLAPPLVPTVGVTYPEYMLPLLSNDSEDSSEDSRKSDPDWSAEFADFACDSDVGNSDWELDEPEVFDEVGPFPDVPVEAFSFETRYGDGQWDSLETTLVGDRESFVGPRPGPTRRPSRRRVPVHEFFNIFWPECDLARICRETNVYALQESVKQPGALNSHGRWRPLTVVELRAWLGVCILMGLKQLPTIRSYWSKRQFYGCLLVKRIMKRPRFEQILSCIHLVNNASLVQDKTAVGYDKIGKCRWLIENFVARSKSAYNCEKHLACDEIMVAYKGRRCDIKQYMKDKPVKYGIKIWCCASSKSRYVYNLVVYEGRKDMKPEKNLGTKVVLNLVSDLTGLGHVVVTDRFFSSPQLADALLSVGTWLTGTVKPNRIGMPTHLAPYAKEELPRGTLVVAMHMSRRMAACVWFDGCPVFLLSTSSDPIAPGCTTKRWVSGKRDDFPTSPIQKEYQEMMRGVDVVDQCRVEYTAQIMTHKWWHRLLFFILDTSLGNAYVLYKAFWTSRHEKGRRKRPMSRADFHYEVALWLTGPSFQLGRTGGSFNASVCGIHESRSAGMTRRKCRLCGRKQNRFCPGCGGVFLCQRSCFSLVHTDAKIAAKIWL